MTTYTLHHGPADYLPAARAAQHTLWDVRREIAAALGVPTSIKRRGRRLALREVDGVDIFTGPVSSDARCVTYIARQKEMRTAWRRHQPVVERLSIEAARAEGR